MKEESSLKIELIESKKVLHRNHLDLEAYKCIGECKEALGQLAKIKVEGQPFRSRTHGGRKGVPCQPKSSKQYLKENGNFSPS